MRGLKRHISNAGRSDPILGTERNDSKFEHTGASPEQPPTAATMKSTRGRVEPDYGGPRRYLMYAGLMTHHGRCANEISVPRCVGVVRFEAHEAYQ